MDLTRALQCLSPPGYEAALAAAKTQLLLQRQSVFIHVSYDLGDKFKLNDHWLNYWPFKVFDLRSKLYQTDSGSFLQSLHQETHERLNYCQSELIRLHSGIKNTSKAAAESSAHVALGLGELGSRLSAISIDVKKHSAAISNLSDSTAWIAHLVSAAPALGPTGRSPSTRRLKASKEASRSIMNVTGAREGWRTC